MSDLHERAARALGWSVADARTLSMQSLRDLVRPVDPELAAEMSYVIQSGAYARGEPQRKPGRRHASKKTKAAQPKPKRFTCPNCGGGLILDDPAYGLVCPACEARVAGPFESGHDIPDYAPAVARSAPSRRSHATKIWQREDWKAPGATEPLKYSWKLVRPHVREDEVEEWLQIYRQDHPGVEFVAAATKPRGKKGPRIMRGPGSEF